MIRVVVERGRPWLEVKKIKLAIGDVEKHVDTFLADASAAYGDMRLSTFMKSHMDLFNGLWLKIEEIKASANMGAKL
jgi:hypothetical protein